MASQSKVDEPLSTPANRSTSAGLVVGLVACLASCTTPEPQPVPPAQQDPAVVPTQPEERFQAIAEAAGHVVQEGALTFATYEGCCDADADCLGNNPATPYGTYALPPSPGEVVAGEDIFAPWGEVPDGLHRDHRLREDEAIVLIGRTPPEVKYFGLRSYVNTRVDPSTGATEVLVPFLHDLTRNVDWLDEMAIEDEQPWIPLASTYTGEDAWLAAHDGQLRRYDVGTLEAADEVWAWAALLGCDLSMALEEIVGDPAEVEAQMGPVRAELAASGCPDLVLWLDAVVHLAVVEGALFWSGEEVEAAMETLRR